MAQDSSFLSDYQLDNGAEQIKNFMPNSLDDAPLVIDYLREKSLILNLANLNEKYKQRFLDLMCGATYALNRKICYLDKDTYIFVEE